LIKKIPDANKWCHQIRDITVTLDSAEMFYFNPLSGDQVSIHGSYPVSKSNWKAIPSAGAGINRFIRVDDVILVFDVQNPNWLDTWYRITVQDQYGFKRSDSVFYETIEPHADFEFKYIPLDDSIYYPGKSENYYNLFYNSVNYSYTSAPALFHFKNLSVNSDSLTWDFGDGIISGTKDDSIMHVYQLPGSYLPKLVAYASSDFIYGVCTDTFPTASDEVPDYPIVVDEASLQKGDASSANQLPNVMTCPNGKNNIFRFLSDVSITDFEIVIYNRYGNRVYHFQGNIRDWEGWDGHDKGSNSYVETGVYYYAVKEINVLPDYETGREVRLAKDFPRNKKAKDQKNSLYCGFIHVYNNE
jgi:hypothetical protein